MPRMYREYFSLFFDLFLCGRIWESPMPVACQITPHPLPRPAPLPPMMLCKILPPSGVSVLFFHHHVVWWGVVAPFSSHPRVKKSCCSSSFSVLERRRRRQEIPLKGSFLCSAVSDKSGGGVCCSSYNVGLTWAAAALLLSSRLLFSPTIYCNMSPKSSFSRKCAMDGRKRIPCNKMPAISWARQNAVFKQVFLIGFSKSGEYATCKYTVLTEKSFDFFRQIADKLRESTYNECMDELCLGGCVPTLYVQKGVL